ncbi:hypothetical protein L905_18335 [Agrobacterium sp. TS43]|nr:hypothetical protein L906_19730 [Agrobacterium sp. TS45]KVK66156.1 hypothetical protein L905_18335 [Agrobacterium sp. TS43]KVK66857.1 hypothetical protein L907_19700 [Agrobacterium sp. C13]
MGLCGNNMLSGGNTLFSCCGPAGDDVPEN